MHSGVNLNSACLEGPIPASNRAIPLRLEHDDDVRYSPRPLTDSTYIQVCVGVCICGDNEREMGVAQILEIGFLCRFLFPGQAYAPIITNLLCHLRDDLFTCVYKCDIVANFS